MLAMVAALGPADWARPTDCTEWRVREMVAHVTGAAEEACLATDGDPAVADRLRGTRVVF